MKNRISLYIFAALAISAVSCSEKEVPVGGEIVQKTFSATIDGAVVTKTTLSVNDNGKRTDVSWCEGDAISVFDSKSNNKFSIRWKDESSAAMADFVGEAEDGAETYYALYPYSETATMAEGKITATIPAMQTIGNLTFDPAAALQITSTKNENLLFKNVCALLKITIPDDIDVNKVSNVKISVTGVDGDSSKGFAGTTTFNASTGEVVSRGEVKEITVGFSAGKAESGVFYVAIAPGTYTGYTVSYMYGSSTLKRTKPTTVTFERNYIYSSANFSDIVPDLLPGIFSVGPQKQVKFTSGNLWCDNTDDSAPKWDIEEEQYQFDATKTGGYEALKDHISHFCWDITGNFGREAICTPQGSGVVWSPNDIMDWGRLFPGCTDLYTLTQEEWHYLFNGRGNAKFKYGYGTVEGVQGVFVLPDMFSDPKTNSKSDSGYFVPAGVTTASNSSSDGNAYSDNDEKEGWTKMEKQGVMFLPLCGMRGLKAGESSGVNSVGSIGDYFSSNCNENLMAGLLQITPSQVRVAPGPITKVERKDVACAVRLAQKQGAPDVKLPEKNLTGKFSVADGKQVTFSSGNLQFLATLDGSGTDLKHKVAGGGTKSGIWRFAKNQFDVYSANYNCCKFGANSIYWQDVFAWSTSGYVETVERNGFTDHSPYLLYNSGDNSDVLNFLHPSPSSFPSDATSYDLTDGLSVYDWGVYNAISNGGDEPGLWRTPTSAEWKYLMKERNNFDALWGFATVCGAHGVILLPDDWSLPGGVSFSPQGTNYTTNRYDIDEWTKMEDAGAVFLPNIDVLSTVYVTGFSPSDFDSATYHSSTGAKSENDTFSFLYAAANYPTKSTNEKKAVTNFRSVRLVKDVVVTK